MNGGEEFPQAPLLSGVAAGRPVSGEELRHSPPSGEEWRPKIGSTNSLKPLRPIFSSSAEEGKADAVAAAGVVLVKKIHLLTSTTPSARAKVASQLFLGRAATPPRPRRGALITAASRRRVPGKVERVSEVRCAGFEQARAPHRTDRDLHRARSTMSRRRRDT